MLLTIQVFSENTELDRFASAVAWLKTCDMSHNECQRRTDLDRPRRLVSVHNEAIKVVDTHTFGNMPPYATLSYCWGRDDFIMLTMETIDSFHEGLNHTDLPQTFQDAIFVTRRLGLDYIWIDALCIIQRQHDSSDWLAESARMRSIYGGGHVNIAASYTRHVYEGFLHRSDGYMGGIAATVSSTEGSHTQVFYARTDNPNYDYQLPSEELPDLAQRGWAFQERLLAKRTLHFRKYGVSWECRISNAYEFAPQPHDRLIDHLACPDHKPWDWTDIVDEYSATKLTVSSDRLTALAGVARRQAEAKPDEYLAGMWRSQLIDQLCWSVAEDEDTRKRPDWTAPTWSWASTDRKVTASWFVHSREEDELSKQEYVSLLDVWTKPRGPDPFGAVSDGELSLECYTLVRGWLTSRKLSTSSTGSAPELSELHISLEASEQRFPIDLDYYSDIQTVKDNDIQVYLLPIRDGGIERNGGDIWASQHILIAGLVLQHIEGSRGRFRRLGAFFFTDDCPSDETDSDEVDPDEADWDENDRDEIDSDEVDSEEADWDENDLDENGTGMGRYGVGTRSDFLRVVTRVGNATAARVCAKLDKSTEKADDRFIVTIE